MKRLLYYYATGSLLAVVLARHGLTGWRLVLVYGACFGVIVAENTWWTRRAV